MRKKSNSGWKMLTETQTPLHVPTQLQSLLHSVERSSSTNSFFLHLFVVNSLSLPVYPVILSKISSSFCEHSKTGGKKVFIQRISG